MVLIAVLGGCVLAVVLIIRGRSASVPVTRTELVAPRPAARPRWERHGLRSPECIPRPVQLLEREMDCG